VASSTPTSVTKDGLRGTMTNRFWRFALTALIGTVLVAVALAVGYRQLTVKNLTELGAEKNTALAQSVSNAAQPRLDQLLENPSGLATAELRELAASSELPTMLSNQLRGLSVFKINVFNADGITVFSTDTALIGDLATSNPGIGIGLAGETVSDIVRRDTLNSFDQVVERRDVIQTYIPIRNSDSVVTGVFEIYSDVTPLLARIADTQRGILAGVVGILGLFYILLVWLYWRTDKKLQYEQAIAQSYLEEIETDKTRITDQRQAKERAEIASQVKSEFFAMMSHEIRTPMNAVLGMTDLLQLSELTRKQQGYIQVIQSSGTMLLSLVDNILDFSSLGTGSLELETHEFGVLELLERVLEITGYHAYSKDLELAGTIEVDTQLRVRGDRNRLRQILVNLVSNAIKFSEQGAIIVSVSKHSQSNETMHLLFSVTDHGIGMTDEVKQQLFTPVTRLDEQPHAKQQGSGLGLAISKQLIEYMGGEIGIESQPGEGSRVWFTVPVENKAQSKPDLSFHIPALQGQRVLTVCRNADVARIVCSYARAWGMSCDSATAADEALHNLQAEAGNAQAYGLVIIDNGQDAVDGLDLAHQIRSTDDIAHLPIILLTPITRPLEPGEISSIGKIFCVNKPVLPSELHLALLKITGSTDELGTDSDAGRERYGDNGELRILIAEDNLVNRRVLTGMLSSLNYSADCVEDGPAVIAALDDKAYDVVLMDCQMPGMDGEQVTEQIRQDRRRFPNQPIIVALTADASAEHRSACLRAGMDDFIAKPLRLEKLRQGLRHWTALAVAPPDDGEDYDSDADFSLNQQAWDQLRDRAAAQDGEFLSHFIELFLQDTATRLDSLGAAFESHDLFSIKRESHALKGACLEFGVVRMAKYCDELHDSAEGEKFDQVQDLLRSLRQEFDRIRPVFEAEKTG